MSQQLNLKEIEKKAYTSYQQDGLTEIALGGSFFIISLVLKMNELSLIVFWPFFVFIMMMIKKRIAAPRIGLVNFSPQRRFREFKTAMGIFLCAIILFLILVLKIDAAFIRDEFKTNYLLFIGVVVSILPAGVGVSTGSIRFYFYNILFFVLLAIAVLTGHSFAAGYRLFGIIVFIIGIGMLIRFLRKHQQESRYSPASEDATK